MTTIDYRAMCAALVDAIDSGISTDRMHLSPIMLRARALLDQPVAVAPTDEELDSVMFQAVWGCMDNASDLTNDEMDRLKARAVLAKWGNSQGILDSSPQPVAVSERLPEPSVKVLAHYFNALGNGRTICAIWVPAKSRSNDGDLDADDFLEYDEEDDKYYWPEGWYEQIENWEDLGWVPVYEGEVAYWQPLPKWPAHTLPLPEQEASK